MYQNRIGDQFLDSPAKSMNNCTMYGSNEEIAKTSFLYGNKRKSVATAGTPSFLNSNTGPSAPSTDIFASPAISSVRSHLRDGVHSNSPKSVHWSPALTQGAGNLSSPLPKSAAPSSTNFASPSAGPPLRSLRDPVEPVKKAPRRSMNLPIKNSAAASTLNSSGIADVSASTDSPSDTWVTVFGFGNDQASNVLNFFSRHGEVVCHQVPKRGNWMHIRYSCAVHARQALARNGAVLDGYLRVGVAPCTDKDVINISENDSMNSSTINRSLINQSIREEPESADEIPALTERDQNTSVADTSMNTSRMSLASRSGMRSMSTAYDHRNTQNMNTANKQDSIMSKLWSAVGL